MRIRVSRPRREFGLDGHTFMERDAGESNMEIKITKTGYFTKKKVLEMGLQAANKMKRFSSQTYFNRMVNAIVQCDPQDFLDVMKKSAQVGDASGADKLEKFIDRVAYRIEEAL